MTKFSNPKKTTFPSDVSDQFLNGLPDPRVYTKPLDQGLRSNMRDAQVHYAIFLQPPSHAVRRRTVWTLQDSGGPPELRSCARGGDSGMAVLHGSCLAAPRLCLPDGWYQISCHLRQMAVLLAAMLHSFSTSGHPEIVVRTWQKRRRTDSVLGLGANLWTLALGMGTRSPILTRLGR